MFLAVGCFSLYHAWCVVCNTTTIESWEKEKVAVLRRKGKILEVSCARRCRLKISLGATLSHSCNSETGIVKKSQEVLTMTTTV